ncbi:MAG: F0F1 ATP synthase subunit B [Patescibacteria group bacterium]
MELIKNFGINPILLGAQVVNFLIVLFILRKLLYKPITQLLQKRKDTIIEGLKTAEEAQKRMEKVLQEEKNILRNAQIQAKKIVEDATLQSIEASKEIQENAKKQSEKILKEVRLQIEKERSETEKRLMENVSSLAIKFLQKSVEQLFSERDQKEVVEKALKKIKILV